MKTYKKHTEKYLDGTKGAWRPTLIAAKYGSDGHPIEWKEIVVVSCHECGHQFGVGGDDDGPQIQEGGTFHMPVRCWHCKCINDVTLEDHSTDVGKKHFASLQTQARQDVKNARVRALQQKIMEQTLRDLEKNALAQAQQLLPDDTQNPQELFKKHLANLN